MDELEQARLDINRIDEEMVRLFVQRMQASRQIAAYKQANRLPIRVPEREKALLERNLALLQNAELEPYYTAFLLSLIEQSCLYQEKLLQEETQTKE